jgi:hypothetical protein
MLDFATAEGLVVKADRLYDSVISEGCLVALAGVRERVARGRYSLDDLALWAVSECRSPSPIQDIQDLRFLAHTVGNCSDIVSMKRFFVAVCQCLREKSVVYPM